MATKKKILTKEKKNKTNKTDIQTILAYSDKKITANLKPPYSTLNPDTSSDSPSAKSKGARLVSTTAATKKTTNKGDINKKKTKTFWNPYKSINLKDLIKKTTDTKIKAKTISYDTVWATARNAPNNAYLELEAQPEKIIPYTDTLTQHKKNKKDSLTSMNPDSEKNTDHTIIVIINPKRGDTQNNKPLATTGRPSSLEKSFKASEKGCKSPAQPSLVGPLRNWMYPNTFRSNKVKKATATKTKIMTCK